MNLKNKKRIVFISVLVVSISILHYVTSYTSPVSHDVYRRLYYLPIILAAFWFDKVGGLSAAIISSLFFLPHVLKQWMMIPFQPYEAFFEIILFNVVGYVTGSFAFREKIEKKNYQQALKNLKETHIGILQALSVAIDARDHYTQGHSMRVKELSLKIGLCLNLPEQELLILEQAALLHDVGKIGIEDQILKKREKLIDEEYEKIKEHPFIGNKILLPVKYLNECRQIIMYHHERYDGKGYPDGLKKEEIPIGSRIIALADTYDAMMSDRHYRKAINEKKVISEIKKCAGSQLDPDVVKAFEKILLEEKKLEILENKDN